MKNTPGCFAILLALLGTPCFAQTWTYQGSQICFQSSPGNSMCFSQGTLTSTATSLLQSQAAGQPYTQNFAQGNAEGAAIGSLVGTLISTWIDHHRRVKAEERALKQELLAYLDAYIEVLEENKKLNVDSAEQLSQLKSLDKSHAQTWEVAEKQSRDGIVPASEKQIQLATKYRADVDKNFHTRKGLDYALNDNKAGAKTLYETALKLTAVSYVIDQLYRAVAGYFENQSQPLQPPTKPNSGK